MKITLYKYSGEFNRVDKTDYLESALDLNVVLKQSTSLLKPVFILTNSKTGTVVDDDSLVVDDITVTGKEVESLMIDYNYMYVPDFKRYYFIDSINLLSLNVYEFICSVDVLMSYKDNIKKLEAYVVRNEYEYDKNIKDDLACFEYSKDITEITPSKGSLVNTTFSTDGLIHNFVLSCISKKTIPSGWVVEPPDSSLPPIQPIYFTTQFSSTSYLLTASQADIIAYRALENSDTIGSYIKALIAVPFDPPYYQPSSGNDSVYINDIAITDLTGAEIKAPYNKFKFSNYIIIADFTITASLDFYNYEPYTNYELFVPYTGWITINANNLLNNRLIVYYTINYEDGSANAYVYDLTNSRLIYTGQCQLGINIPISTTNNEQIAARKNANNLNLALGLISSGISAGVGLVTGNPLPVIAGTAGAAKIVANNNNSNSLLFNKAQATFSSGNSGLFTSQKVILRKTSSKLKSYDSDFRHLYGAPCNKYILLSSLSGYTVIDDCRFTDFYATENEVNMLTNLFKSGIIL